MNPLTPSSTGSRPIICVFAPKYQQLESQNRILEFAMETRQYSEAQDACIRRGADLGRKRKLVEPMRKEEMEFLQRTFNQLAWKRASIRPMIGVKFQDNRYRYASKGIVVAESNLRSLTKKQCVQVDTDSIEFTDHDCTIESEFVCEYSVPLDIKCMEKGDISNDQCFGFVAELNTYDDAVSKCSKYAKSLGRIGKLVEPRNAETSTFIGNSLKSMGWNSATFWIGLIKTTGLGQVAYLSDPGTYLQYANDYTPWELKPQPGDCVSAKTVDGKWKRSSCEQFLPVVCEINPEVTISCTQNSCFAFSSKPVFEYDAQTTCHSIGLAKNVVGILA